MQIPCGDIAAAFDILHDLFVKFRVAGGQWQVGFCCFELLSRFDYQSARTVDSFWKFYAVFQGQNRYDVIVLVVALFQVII